MEPQENIDICTRLTEENKRLTAENNRLSIENARLHSENAVLQAQVSAGRRTGVMVGVTLHSAISALTPAQLAQLDSSLTDARTTLLNTNSFQNRENFHGPAIAILKRGLNNVGLTASPVKTTTGDGNQDCDNYLNRSLSDRERIMACLDWLKARSNHHGQRGLYDWAIYVDTLLGLLEYRLLL